MMFARIVVVFALPVFAFLALWIWRPTLSSGTGKPVSDRVAWTVFAVGICLMFSMVLYVAASEGDGTYRSWDTIRLHTRVFLALALIAVLGPLIVSVFQAMRPNSSKPPCEESPDDDLN